jgi:choline-sulfatase
MPSPNEERLTTDIYPADFAWTPDWDNADERIGKWYHGMDTLHEAGEAMLTYQFEYDEEVGFATKRRLYDYARDNAARAASGSISQPFFMCASFIHPHDPYVARPEWWNQFDHDDIDPHAARIRAGIDADAVGHTDEHVRNSRHGY